MIEDVLTSDKLYLQHPSVLHVTGSSEFERYEFLGDKVLGFCVADILLKGKPYFSEGDLSRTLNVLVSKKIVTQVAKKLDIQRFFSYRIKNVSDSVLTSMCEVVIAALYVNKGWDAVYAFIGEHWGAWLSEKNDMPIDYKTRLQEYVAELRMQPPVYQLKDKTGPDHDAKFICAVAVEGLGQADGIGCSKQAAEEEAIKNLCLKYRISL